MRGATLGRQLAMPLLTIDDRVGPGCKNLKVDMLTVRNLLAIRLHDPYYGPQMRGISIPNPDAPDFAAKLFVAIELFQRLVQGLKSPDGIVSANGQTILYLGGVRNAGKLIIVDLNWQNLFAYFAGELKFSFDAATGDNEHPTAVKPTLFSVTRREAICRSKKYNAQMNYALFFSDDGKAIHQSHAVGVTSILKSFGADYFGSHGCVRLAESDARTLFEWTPMSTPVFIDLSRKGLE
jgi:hypothetical protein